MPATSSVVAGAVARMARSYTVYMPPRVARMARSYTVCMPPRVARMARYISCRL